MFNLPEPVLGLVMDYADTRGYWKTRFSNDVLTEINKGIKFVGCDTYDGEIVPCGNCYAYGLCDDVQEENDVHECYMEISYDQLKSMRGSTLLAKLCWIPLEVHEWACNHSEVANIRKIREEIEIKVCGVDEFEAYSNWWGS